MAKFININDVRINTDQIDTYCASNDEYGIPTPMITIFSMADGNTDISLTLPVKIYFDNFHDRDAYLDRMDKLLGTIDPDTSAID